LVDAKEFQIFAVAVDRFETSMRWIGSAEKQAPISDIPIDDSTHVLLVDGIARSGQTLLRTYAEFTSAFKSSKIWSYAVAVCRVSAFIPSWYGVMYDDSTHVIFSRDGGTPNVSLYERRGGVGAPALALRLPRADDPEFTITGPKSMVRYTVFDRHFDHVTNAKQIYVLEWDGVPIGYVAFHVEADTLWLDYILVCADHEKKRGAGTSMISHVENFARSSSCTRIVLWAIDEQREWYEKRKFLRVGDSVEIGYGSDSEKYLPMAMSLKADMNHYF